MRFANDKIYETIRVLKNSLILSYFFCNRKIDHNDND
jgi:hypothetical protein